jgi:hypothetical protein
LRRQATDGRTAPAGSSRDERLDPFSLPLRFETSDSTADARVRSVELTRERVVMRRSVRGMLMALNLPVKSYLGVALRIDAAADKAAGALAVVLEHRDGALSLPLYRAQDGSDIVAEWQSWARVLSLPLLVVEPDGGLREPFARIGAVRVAAPLGRRRKRSAIKARRPSIFLRRRKGRSLSDAAVHHGEREIIARN